jgi:hypothetical protein
VDVLGHHRHVDLRIDDDNTGDQKNDRSDLHIRA